MARIPSLAVIRRRPLDERGTGLIEFALIAPVFLIGVTGIVDGARGYAAKMKLENATHRALEAVVANPTLPDYTVLVPETATAAGEPVTNVALDQWIECNRVRQPSTTLTCPVGAEISRYVKFTIISDYKPTFVLGTIANAAGRASDGAIRLSVNQAVRIQ